MSTTKTLTKVRPAKFHVPRLPKTGESITNGEAHYTLGEELGKGYFGKVYACSDLWANDLVAKVLMPPNQTYDQVKQLWSRELENLVVLRHPNVTYVHDAFEHRRTFYLIIERCHSDLNDLFQIADFDGSLWLPAIARDLLQAVDFIHRSGYVHKDIHPGNVFVALSRDRMVPDKDEVISFKIGDLGITKLESDINVFNTMLAQWMLPPEAIEPTFGMIGRQVDIYHVGLLLLSVLLGRVPTFSKQEVLDAQPRLLAESLKSPYSGALSKALRRNVDARTPTAAEFWGELLDVMPEGAIPI